RRRWRRNGCEACERSPEVVRDSRTTRSPAALSPPIRAPPRSGSHRAGDEHARHAREHGEAAGWRLLAARVLLWLEGRERAATRTWRETHACDAFLATCGRSRLGRRPALWPTRGRTPSAEQ